MHSPSAPVRRGRLVPPGLALLILLMASQARAQDSAFALRFHGTGSSQQDRVRIQVDDNSTGTDQSTPCDVGAGSFTIDFWIRGLLADNPTENDGGDTESASASWAEGNMLVDRDIWGGSEADWGVSVAGGFIRFGTGRGAALTDLDNTIEGSVNVLDDTWHHVAVVRDQSTGIKRIYVDGLLDFQSSPGASDADISYPNNGVPGQLSPWGPYIVLGAEKHDAGPEFPSFNGFMDEFRVWNIALTQRDLLDFHDRVVALNATSLQGYYRFEEGSGTSLVETSVKNNPNGLLIAGVPGNGEWVAGAAGSLATAPVSSGALPAGFQATTLFTGLTEPVVIKFTPDGRLLIGQRNGTIRIFQNGALLPTPLITIPVITNSDERGLVGLTLDPNFTTNGWMYAYFTTTEPRNRVGRFTVVGNTASLASQVLIWQNPHLAADWHHGGEIAFGPDGKFYIATGDQFDSQTAQQLTNQHGKMLRINPDGSIPADNPFLGTAGAEPPIWAYGLRNPFRYVFDSLTGRLLIGDVGGNSDTSWEEVNVGAAGANYGWPLQEGPICYTPPCTSMTFPIFTYQHNDPRYVPGQPQAAVVSGPVYRSTAFPPRFRGSQYLGDYANRAIRRLVFDQAGAVLGDPLFYRPPSAGTLVDIEVGPDGALYYVTVGLPVGGDPSVAGVFRIAWSGGGNQLPQAGAGANVTLGTAPLAVQFSGATSLDPDNGPSPLTYDWDFDDGGSSTVRDPGHTYVANGRYVAELRVSDGLVISPPATVTVDVGQRPTAGIVQPAPGTTYRAGDLITFNASASDPDGVLSSASYSWRVLLVHALHAHPFIGPLDGIEQGQFAIPISGHSPENTSYEIQLTVTDADGLTASASRPIMPVLSSLQFNTSPSGIPIFLDGEGVATPRSYQSNEGFIHTVEAQSTFTLGGTSYGFQCWSDGGAQVHGYTAPPGSGSLTANYVVGPPQSLSPPGPVTDLAFTTQAGQMTWSAVAGAAAYDLLRGTITSPGPFNHACLQSGLGTTSATDSATPSAETAYYYFVRGRNVCGPGSLGTTSAGAARPGPVCP